MQPKRTLPTSIFKDKTVKTIQNSIVNSGQQRATFIQNIYAGPLNRANLSYNNVNPQSSAVHNPTTCSKQFRGKFSSVGQNQEQQKLVYKGTNMQVTRTNITHERSRNQLHHKRCSATLQQQVDKIKANEQSNRSNKRRKMTKLKQSLVRFQLQFEKQIYWSGSNAYLVSGVKMQYEKMKENYENKCREYDALLKEPIVSQNRETKQYIQAMEEENKRLAALVAKLEKETFPRELEKDGRKQQKMQTRVQSLSVQVKKSKQKIIFLQKLLIEKDNRIHQFSLDTRKLQRQSRQLEEKILHLQSELTINQAKSTQQLKIVQQSQRRKYDADLTEVIYKLREKDALIDRLRRENTRLENLLDSWKTSHQSRRTIKNPETEEKRSKQFAQKQAHSFKQPNSQPLKANRTPHKNLIEEPLMQLTSSRMVTKRMQITANTRHSDNCVKNRKVDKLQIQPLAHYLRYLLISKGLALEETIQMFDCAPGSDQWTIEFVSMGQVRQKLLLVGMQEQNALLLSRYIVQDCTTEYVYTHDNNEHQRNIVKSIIRSLLGQYPIFTTKLFEAEQLLRSHRHRLQGSLQMRFKSGQVRRQDFIELLKTLGVVCNNEEQQYFIAKMIKHSDDIDHLVYAALFSDS